MSAIYKIRNKSFLKIFVKTIDTVIRPDRMTLNGTATALPDNMETKTMATYNGHKNWNHWNVSLWINNDEGLYHDARWAISCTNNRSEAINLFLELREKREEFSTPDGAPYSKSAVRSAMVGM